MNSDNLITMANRIGQYFQSWPSEADAIDGIATHIDKFWEPRMRRHMASILASGDERLLPIVAKALRARPEVLGAPPVDTAGYVAPTGG